MINKQFGLCLMAIVGLLHMGTASAATVSLSSISPTVGIGDSVNVELSISGLGSDILSVFDLNIGFDDSILSFQSFSFGTDLFVSIQDPPTLGAGIVNVFELSLELDGYLESNQPDDFVLGTFIFEALNIGTSALTIAENFGLGLVGAGFAPLQGVNLESGSVSAVPVPAVPVPAALWLFGTGLIGLVGFSRRRKAV
jgi:hypothetical protein